MKKQPAKRLRTINYVPVVASVGLVAASAGAPQMSCMDVNQPDIAVANDARTTVNPLLLKRDNPAIGGDLYVKSLVKGQITNPYLTDATWFGTVTGHTELSEYRDHDWPYTAQRSPILPRANVNSASDAAYGTRSGLMIHKNHYGLTLSAADTGGDTFSETNSAYVALDPNVMLVPVVIVNWKRAAGQADWYYNPDQALAMTNMFDFNPVNLGTPKGYTSVPDGCDNFLCIGTQVPVAPLPNSRELASQIESADGVKNYKFAPDKYEQPPDDIWTQCGIQFQVVAQYDVTLPAGWTNKCSVNGDNVPLPNANTPIVNDPLLKQLDPLFVSYVDTQTEGCPFWGVTNMSNHHVEVSSSHGTGHGADTTAHELGHALGLDHLYLNGQPVSGNLMASNGPNGGGQGSGWTALTAAQCTAARTAAAFYSARYDQYNYLTGRTYSSTPPPALPVSGGAGDGGGIIIVGGGGSGTGSQTCSTNADCGSGNQCIGGTCSPLPH